MEGQLIGYNIAEIEALRDVVNTLALDACELVLMRLNYGVIAPMSTAWYSPEAKAYFDKFAGIVKAKEGEVQAAFDNFRSAIQSIGEQWAYSTGNATMPQLASIDSVALDLDVSTILESDANGNVGIIEDSVKTVIDGLPDLETSIKTTLEFLATKLNAESAFIGGNQATAIEECFKGVGEAVRKIFEFLSTSEDSLYSQVTAYVEKYKTQAEGIKNTVNATNVYGYDTEG